MIIGSQPRLDTISETPKILYGDYQFVILRTVRLMSG